jgi:hypothetical protein
MRFLMGNWGKIGVLKKKKKNWREKKKMIFFGFFSGFLYIFSGSDFIFFF